MSYSPHVSLALVNGKIVTVDEQDSIAEAVAIYGNRIIKVGTDDEIRAIVEPATEVIDLGGRGVPPRMDFSLKIFFSYSDYQNKVPLIIALN